MENDLKLAFVPMNMIGERAGRFEDPVLERTKPVFEYFGLPMPSCRQRKAVLLATPAIFVHFDRRIPPASCSSGIFARVPERKCAAVDGPYPADCDRDLTTQIHAKNHFTPFADLARLPACRPRPNTRTCLA
jgi:hypothetical protein